MAMTSQSLYGSMRSITRCLVQQSLRARVSTGLHPGSRAHTSKAGGATVEAATLDAPHETSTSYQQQEAPTTSAFRAHIDFKFVRDNVELVVQNCAARLTSADPRRVVQLYEEMVQVQQETDKLRAARNENSVAMKVSRATRGGWSACVRPWKCGREIFIRALVAKMSLKNIPAG
jgi:hypothetical protein